MNYIIFDLEWNQASHGEEDRVEGLPFEIVEIGAVKLNESRDMVSEFSKLIKPQVYKEMHFITSRLVHLQMDELQKGDTFPVVMKEFLDWCGDDCLFCTWGALDLLELQRNMAYYKMEPLSDSPIKFYDIQKLFSLAYEDGKSRKALEDAIDMMNIRKDIPFHRAFSDAYYTAKVFDKIEDPNVLEKFSFDTFNVPTSKEQEVHIIFSDYDKYISRLFNNRKELLNDKGVTSTVCYKCGRPIKKKINWFTPNGKHYYAVSSCFRHGLMKSKIRVRKAEKGGVYAVKTDKYITKEDMKKLIDKRDNILLQKQQKKEDSKQ
ncbi:MAG: exonuclease domain-containing protein [Lachnospiraceae bacterium]|nr:exonuclease domain-containing protein [Lachnospiraceae bacterium]